MFYDLVDVLYPQSYGRTHNKSLSSVGAYEMCNTRKEPSWNWRDKGNQFRQNLRIAKKLFQMMEL